MNKQSTWFFLLIASILWWFLYKISTKQLYHVFWSWRKQLNGMISICNFEAISMWMIAFVLEIRASSSLVLMSFLFHVHFEHNNKIQCYSMGLHYHHRKRCHYYSIYVSFVCLAFDFVATINLPKFKFIVLEEFRIPMLLS